MCQWSTMAQRIWNLSGRTDRSSLFSYDFWQLVDLCGLLQNRLKSPKNKPTKRLATTWKKLKLVVLYFIGRNWLIHSSLAEKLQPTFLLNRWHSNSIIKINILRVLNFCFGLLTIWTWLLHNFAKVLAWFMYLYAS